MATTSDPNRVHWKATARGVPTDWAGLATDPDGVTEESVDDPAGLWLRPADAIAGPVVLAIHGGGLVSGSAATHRRMFGHLARASRARRPGDFVVEYGLVPEHVSPSQLDTVTTAYQWLLTSPWADLEPTGDADDSGSDPLFSRQLVRVLAAGYLAGADPPDRMRNAGVDVRLDELAGELHMIQMAAGRTRVADDAIARGGS